MFLRRWIVAPALALLSVGCPTPDVEPAFPEDYAATYAEVRDCRRSPEHELAFIRVLASPDAAGVYTTRTGDFPEGSVVLKEEYADPDCVDLSGFTVMQREGDDWRWQDVAVDRTVMEDGAIARCAGCHARCETPPAGYRGTCAVP